MHVALLRVACSAGTGEGAQRSNSANAHQVNEETIRRGPGSPGFPTDVLLGLRQDKTCSEYLNPLCMVL